MRRLTLITVEEPAWQDAQARVMLRITHHYRTDHAALRALREALANAVVSADQRRALTRALEGVCGGPDGRDAFLRRLGAGEIGDLSPGWVLALLEWGSGNAAKAALASAEARALMASAA